MDRYGPLQTLCISRDGDKRLRLTRHFRSVRSTPRRRRRWPSSTTASSSTRWPGNSRRTRQDRVSEESLPKGIARYDLVLTVLPPGGSLGWKGKGSLDPKFEEVAFALETSTTTSPKFAEVKTGFGYHIIMVSRLSLLQLSELQSNQEEVPNKYAGRRSKVVHAHIAMTSKTPRHLKRGLSMNFFLIFLPTPSRMHR